MERLYFYYHEEIEKRGVSMTIDEASERYKIPIEILEEYASWGLCQTVKQVMGAWEYDDRDLERLSMIMTLHDIGFSNEEVESYIRLLLKGPSTEAARIRMLDQKRDIALDEIHFKQKQLDRLDYLRYKIKKVSEKSLTQGEDQHEKRHWEQSCTLSYLTGGGWRDSKRQA
jgi:DNA-binding transcriptional MerR regulator